MPLEKMEEIKLKFCGKFSHENVTSAIYKTKKLMSFEYYSADENTIKALVFSCVNLIVLDLYCCSDIDNVDSLLIQLFKNNKKLECLKLFDFKNMTGECFLYLNKSIVKKLHYIELKILKKII